MTFAPPNTLTTRVSRQSLAGRPRRTLHEKMWSRLRRLLKGHAHLLGGHDTLAAGWERTNHLLSGADR
jgi:hypothetical protein